MITEHDLKEAIAECEGQRNPSSSTCLKLAAFYIIRDKMFPANKEENNMSAIRLPQSSYSYAMSAEDIKPKTEFRQAVTLVSDEEFLSIMDELMTTLKAVIPKLYDGVMRKLTDN